MPYSGSTLDHGVTMATAESGQPTTLAMQSAGHANESSTGV